MDKQSSLEPGEVYDLLMGLSRLTRIDFLGDVAKVMGDLAPAGLTIALNPKQVASKMWLMDMLHAHAGGLFDRVTIVGGWHGVLSGMLLNDPRYSVGRVTSIDIDPSCAPVATLLNRRFVAAGRFEAVTGDMHATGPDTIGTGADTVVINTSCEHIPDVGLWLRTLPRSQLVVLQSNDYVAVPEHISCVASAEEFAEKSGLSDLVFKGSLPSRRYTRFMLIGRT
ncbi:MAG: class I SAM-dependent methyltransferase [Bosea sp. (in: a-proteobacteria)]